MATMRGADPRRAVRLLHAVVGVIILLLVALVVVRPRMSVNPYPVVLVGVLLAVVVVLWMVGAGPAAGLLRRGLATDRRVGVAATVMILLNGVVAGLVGYFGAYQPRWDPSNFPIVGGLPPEQWPAANVGYFSRYPNNHAFLGVADLAAASARIGLGFWPFMAILAGVIAAVTALALYRVVAVVRGGRWAVASLVPLLLLVVASPWMAVPYTDMAALWVPITAIWGLVSAVRRRAVPAMLLGLLSGILLGAGYLIKTTPIVGAVAGVLVLAGLGFGDRHRAGRYVLIVVGLVAGVAVGGVGLRTVVERTVPMPPLTPGVSASPWTYVAAGLHIENHPVVKDLVVYGGYSGDVDEASWDRPQVEQETASRAIIREDLDRRGIVGTLLFELNKFVFNNGDGMFWAYGEGTDLQAPRLHTGPVSDGLAAVNAPDGRYWPTRVALAQGLWLAILVAAGVGLVGRRRSGATEEQATVDLMIWNMIGIAAFMLLFQGRSRYLFGHVPVMIALAVSVVPLRRVWGRQQIAD